MRTRIGISLATLALLPACSGSDLDSACRQAASLPVMTEAYAATDRNVEAYLETLSDAIDGAEASDSDAAIGLVAALNAWWGAVDDFRARRRTRRDSFTATTTVHL